MKNLYLFLLLLPSLLTAQLTLVTNLNPGPEDGFDCFNFCTNQPLVKLGTKWITVSMTPETGRELMLLEDDNLSLLKDVNPGAEDARISLLRKHEGVAYFAARDAGLRPLN